MASKELFSNSSASTSPATDTVNEAGGRAYSLEARAALAQLAVTGCFNNTFYSKGADQLAKVKDLVTKVDPAFVGKVAIYAREKGMMKDMPAFLLVWLSGQMSVTKHKFDALCVRRKKLVEGGGIVPEDMSVEIDAADHVAERRHFTAHGFDGLEMRQAHPSDHASGLRKNGLA